MRNKRINAPMTLLDIVKNGYFQHVRYLVDQGVDLDQRDDEKRTALMLCAFIEREPWGVGISRLLIENGANLSLKDKYGLNPFQYAVIYERVDLVRVFLKAIDFDLNGADKQGNTALHYAVRAGNSTITHLIAQAHVKYRIDFEKRNYARLTALQEAIRLNQRKCIHILENLELLEDRENLEANIPLDLKSADYESDAMSFKSSRRSLNRPRSSMMSYRSSKASFTTNSEYSFRRSQTLFKNDTRRLSRRDPDVEIPPNEKNLKKLIRCASLSDLRNNAEYLFQMTPMDAAVNMDTLQSPPKRVMRAKSAFVRRSEVEAHPSNSGQSWRTEFRKLYVHFQYQCTPSYRDTAWFDEGQYGSLPMLDKPITPANSEHALDDPERGRKSRVKSAAAIRQNTEENLNHAGKGRQVAKSNSRKISQNVGHGGKMGGSVDPALESSSESINSSVSSKKQADGKISSKPPKGPSGGRDSRAASHKQVPAVNVDEIQPSPGVDDSQQDPRHLRVIDE